MMKKNYSIEIKAPKEKVWKVLWDDDSYRKWTGVFHEGSYAETDWKEGSKVLFLTPEKSGMYSNIEKKIDNELMTFKHLGIIKNGVEMPPDEESAKWAGGEETYILKGSGGVTELTVSHDLIEEYEDFFEKTFPKALQKIKELSEK